VATSQKRIIASSPPVEASVRPSGAKASDQIPAGMRCRPADQHQERRLKGILGGMTVAEHLAADGQHHRSVPGQDCLERRLGRISLVLPVRRCDPLQVLAVGQPDAAPHTEKLPQMPADLTG
jgi:hypothetical protein